jgi:hypothetical protein
MHCECADVGCPVCNGEGCDQPATTTLYRTDIEDTTGTEFCDGCGEDAYSVGLFRTGG